MFEFLTEPRYPKAALGISAESVTALTVQRDGGGYGIRQAATVELPNGLLVPSFLEQNIKNPAEFAVLLEEAVTSAGLRRQKSWSVSLPSIAARSAILTMDSGSEKEQTDEVLDWKAEQTFGVPAGELRITRHKMSPDRDGRARVFASAIKLAVIDEYEMLFETFGWQAGLILPRSVSEARWILGNAASSDSLLVSQQFDGFNAVLSSGGEPVVIRSVTCQESEREDELYRLLMFYNDRLGADRDTGVLDKVLLIGHGLFPENVEQISQEALGRSLHVLTAEDVGLTIPSGALTFDDLAAPAGLAALGV